MNVRKNLIDIGIWLRGRNSECDYMDYFNVAKKDLKLLTMFEAVDWKRHLRKMKEEGTFYGSDGKFLPNNLLFENKQLSQKPREECLPEFSRPTTKLKDSLKGNMSI